MKEVKLVIKLQLTDEKFNSEEFQDFLQYIEQGGLLQEMTDELFLAIKTYYFIKEKPQSRNPGG